jgi:RNA 2',3'-cyclic 3'-phosphodiesterase
VTIRAFVAVLLPEAVRDRIHATAAGLRARAPTVAWVRADNLHLTLRFLGEVEPTALAVIDGALAQAAGTVAPFPVTLGGLGGFPGPRTPRVVWVGVTEGAGGLVALHAGVEAALGAVGVAPEGRSYHPHVTLGRARGGRSGPDVGARGDEAWGWLGTFRVEAIHLMRSELARGGARYAALGEHRLQAPAAPP